MSYRNWILSAIIIFFIGCTPSPDVTETTSEDVNVMQDPIQDREVDKQTFSLKKGDFTIYIRPMAKYDISAQVKSRERYRTGWTSKISPVDFALAWQGLTQKIADKYIEYWQSGRWYYYKWKAGCPFSKQYIIRHSANNHILPATENLRRAVIHVNKGDHIRLKGYLVFVSAKDSSGGHYTWNSSLTRNDSGDHSCEVMWVTELQKDGKIYR